MTQYGRGLGPFAIPEFIPGITAEQEQAAVRICAAYAKDADDLREPLLAIGLHPERTPA